MTEANAPSAVVSKSERQRNRADVRHVCRYNRAMMRLREVWAGPRMTIKMRLRPKPEILDAPRWVDIQNLLTRFRPIYLDSEKVSFKSVVSILPRHVTLNKPALFGELASRWEQALNSTTAAFPEGARIVGLIPGYDAVATSALSLTLFFDHEMLTGREVIDLSLYGELVHVDPSKERKRLRIKESDVEPGYRLCVMAVASALILAADTLREIGEEFISKIDPEKVKEIEAELDP